MSNAKEIARLEENFARVMKTQQFISPSFSLYGGATGFQTYGVLGRTLFSNISEMWRRMFVHDMSDHLTGDSMVYEIDSPIVTPHAILKASGHVDRFTDPIVYDAEGRLERVDHYLKHEIEKRNLDQSETAKLEAQIESGSPQILSELLEIYGEKSRGFGPIQEVNLMLSTQTSYSNNVSYLRPETAQGAFTEFKSLFSYNKDRLPFGIVNIGKAYRKEVSPVPFTRMREFYQAELEYFYDPSTLSSVTDLYERVRIQKDIFKKVVINVTTKDRPEQIQKMVMLDLIRREIIQNELIFKFVVRALLFCFRIGINPDRLRLRQHMDDELAHYSSDCWDLEFDMSFSTDCNRHQWLEIIGISDRGTYDLSAHQKDSGQSMKIKRYFDQPREVTERVVTADPKYWGKTYRADAKTVLAACESKLSSNPDLYLAIMKGMGPYVIMLDEPIVSKWKKDADGNLVIYREIKVDMKYLSLKEVTQTIEYEEFVPSVVEPSFGLDRIIYSVLRSAFKIRDTEKTNVTEPDRTYMAFEQEVNPIRYGVISLINSEEHMIYVRDICDILDQSSSASKMYRVDTTSVSIGKKYARMDEVGIHTVFTVDDQTLEDKTFTVRNRDTMEQSRIHISQLASHVMEYDSTRSASNSNTTYREICRF
jgi:glycyl-tRNA synthetase